MKVDRTTFAIFDGTERIFFPCRRLKSKVDFIKLLLEITRYMLVYPVNQLPSPSENSLVLSVGKTSRLYVFGDRKFYSISFPFDVCPSGEGFGFSFCHELDVDSRLISLAIEILESPDFDAKSSLDFIGNIVEHEESTDDRFWLFIRELLLMDHGYIRYDHDPAGFEKASSDGQPHKHPLHHFDLFYSSKATIKFGLRTAIDSNSFIDMLIPETDCKYIDA